MEVDHYFDEGPALEVTSPPEQQARLLEAQLGGLPFLSKLLVAYVDKKRRKRKGAPAEVAQQHLEEEILTTVSCVLALQARHLHEYRFMIAGIQDRNNLAKGSYILRALGKLYFRSVMDGYREPYPCARDAALYAASLSSIVFLTGDDSKAPCRGLVGQQYVDSQWVGRIAEALSQGVIDVTGSKGVAMVLSLLSSCCHDSRRARAALLSSSPASSSPGALLPHLLKAVCRSKTLPAVIKVRALCIIINCISSSTCMDDSPNQPVAELSNEVSSMVAPIVEALILQAGLVKYLYGLLSSSASVSSSACTSEEEDPALGDQQGPQVMAKRLAAEGLLSCLYHCPSLTLSVLKDRGAFQAFPSLVLQQHQQHDQEGQPSGPAGSELMTQRFAVTMLGTVVDLLSRPRDRHQHDSASHSSSSFKQPPPGGKLRRPSLTGSTKGLQQQQNGGGSTRNVINASSSSSSSKLQQQQQPAAELQQLPPPFSPAEFIAHLSQSASLIPLAWLLLHYDDRVQSGARRVWRYIRTCSNGWVEPFIEQGGVPILFRCWAQQSGQGYGSDVMSNESVTLAQQLLETLQSELQLPDMLSQLVLRTTSITVHQRCRGNIAIALLLLSCGAPRILESFVRGGGLHCILNMIHNPNTRESAISFLVAVDSLIEQEPRPACWEAYVQDDGDLFFEESGNGLADTRRVKPGDMVVLVQNVEVTGRKTVIEMACPPAETLAQASPVLRDMLEEAEATATRPTLQGSYEVWEEIMSHIAQPSCFGRAQARYSPDLLVEMMAVAHKYGLWELKTVYGIKLACFLEESTALTIFHAALSAQHTWLSVAAYRALLDSIDYVCSRSTRAVPLAVQLMEELLTNLLLS